VSLGPVDAIDSNGQVGQVVDNIVSEKSQVLSLVSFTKSLVEKGIARASPRIGRTSVVQDDSQQRAVDLEREFAVVLDEAQLLELV
jgi:hypothetical protein